MRLRIDGIWTGLAWGGAFSGRPAIQLVLKDVSRKDQDSEKALSLSIESLARILRSPANRLNMIQVHAAKLDTRGRVVEVRDPLSQVTVYPFITHMLESLDLRLSVHVNNQTDISLLDPRANTILIPSPPSSGNESQNYWANLNYLSEDGEILFVLNAEEDYRWMKSVLNELNLANRFLVHMTTGKTRIPQSVWAKRLIKDSVPVQYLPPIPFTAIPLKIDKPEQQSRYPK